MHQSVNLLGNIGQDLELKYSPAGMAILNMSLATTKKWSKDGQKQEKTSWHRVTIFGKMAENAQKYLSKGDQVFVTGEIDYHVVEKDGNKTTFTNIICNELKYVKTKSRDGETGFSADDIPWG